MIGGATTGGGGSALGRHLVNADHNYEVRPGSSWGVMADAVPDQVAELTELAKASGHKAPLRHVYASPPPGATWDDARWDAYWALYEKAMGLEGCAFSEAVHDKPGDHGRPGHRHRVYLALTDRGTLVRTGHDYARQEAVSRIVEHDTSAAFVRGAHNIRAAHIARSLGRDDVADAMQAAGLLDGARARADLTPQDRQQQERTHVSKQAMGAMVAQAWAASDSGPAFVAALADQGLRLAHGDKRGVPVVLDVSGNVHAITRLLIMDAKATGGAAPKPAEVQARLAGMTLPTMEQAQQQPVPQPVAAPSPAPNHAVDALAAAATTVPDTPATAGSATAIEGADGETSASQAASGGGDGGGAATHDAPASGAMDDAGDGPGEPPGPNASPDERARYLAKLAAWEERKAAAWTKWIASQKGARPASPSGGTAHAHGNAGVHYRHPGGAGETNHAYGCTQAGQVPGADADLGIHHTGAASWDGHAGTSPMGEAGHDDIRHARQDGRRVEPAARLGSPATGRGTEPGTGTRGRDGRGPHGAEGHAGNPAYPRGGVVKALAAASRFRAAVAGASLDKLHAARAAMHMDSGQRRMAATIGMLSAAQDDLARQRTPEPHPDPLTRDPARMGKLASQGLYKPLQAAQDALRCALDRHDAARKAWRWWKPASWTEANRTASTLAFAHAALASAVPLPTALEAARHKGAIEARRAARVHDEWQRAQQALDRRKQMLDGIGRALEAHDPAMLGAMQHGGVDAAMRLQGEVEHRAMEAQARGEAEIRQDSTVVAFRVPRRR